MTRFAILSALALAALSAAADAQPALPGLTVVDAKASSGKLTWTETAIVPVTKEIEVVETVNGVMVTVKRKVSAFETVAVTRELELKKARATDAAGKAIDADKLAERFKESAPLILLSSPLPLKHRALFKDTAVFIEPAGSVAPMPAPPGKNG